ncbi:MAG TPA: hotdog fold thioesterase [Gemmatimonadales bacterium]
MTEAARRAGQIADAMLAKDEFSRWLGIELLQVRPSWCMCRMSVRPEMVNGFGVAHGGIVFSLADSALAFASNTQGRIAMSIENAITYPASVQPGDLLTAVAEEESATNRLGFFRVRVTNQRDDIVALFRGTVYKTSQEHP